ncbi:MAG: hypothetical protein K2X55_16165 [Burkholderiaceae bacterium]|nr:hypothetical protein [Burkholderiaceae bacterium]
MKELDAAINTRLEHILPDRLATAQAAIAVTLNRPDADQRVQTAQALRTDRGVPEQPKAPAAVAAPAAPATPTATAAPAAQTELQTLRVQFKQQIASATASGDKPLTIAELQDRIATRHHLYDNLAILTRMDRREAIVGGAQPKALGGVVSPGLATQWAKLDAADLQSMLRAVGNRLEHFAPIQSTINLINGTSERDRVYQSSVSQVAPTMREDIAAARQHSESLAVAEFIRVNHTNPEWKIQSNLDRAAPALQRILKDSKRMGELDAAVQEHLPGWENQQRQAVLATIAGDLQPARLAANRTAPPPVHQQSPVAQAEQAHNKASPQGTAMPEPTPPTANSASPDKVATLQSTRNGIVPASGVPADHAPVIKKLLEDMSYKIRTDGSVLYQVQGKDAFVDHGDQLLMVKGAEKEERAILGALLLAKEKYAGAFELTGSEAFKRVAIEVLAKYKLDVQLKSPEQDLLRKEAGGKQAQTEFTRATPEHPAAPMDLAPLAARATTSASPIASAGAPQPHSTRPKEPLLAKPVPTESADTSTDNLLQGRLLGHGAAPLKNAKDGKPSYFVQIQNPNGESRTFWGLDLERALVKSGAQKGDQIVLQNLGRKPVQVNAPTHDNVGNVTGMGTVISHRNAWEISTLQPVARRSEAIAIAEASPALQANSVAVREAAWWQRQIPLVQACMEQNPALRGKIEELGPRPDSRDVAWIDTHGDRRVVANDISYGALCDRMPSIKDCLQPVVAMEGGTLDGQSKTAGLKLIRASENYLQGVAQVDGKMRHVVALLPSASSDASQGAGTPIPLMAAIPAPDGFTWERVGQLRADKPALGAMESKHPATMNVEIGRETISLKLHTQPGDTLHQRLGLSAASDHPPGQNEPTGQRQPTSGNRTNIAPTRPTKPDTPSYA